MPGTLYVCATPIGNLGDVTERLIATLRDVHVVYAEDTRRTGRLLEAIGVTTPLRSLFVGNERERSAELAERLVAGDSVALVTDAGTPGISDPGHIAVREAGEVGATVVPIPGPSAVTALLSVSGLPSDRFVFEGFLPRKTRDRQRRLDELSVEARTTVLYVAPHRAGDDLADLASRLGAHRGVVVGRELTKLHEEVWVTTLGEAASRYGSEQPKGELVVAIAGAVIEGSGELEAAVDDARRAVAGGATIRDAARDAAARYEVARKKVYEALIAGGRGSGE